MMTTVGIALVGLAAAFIVGTTIVVLVRRHRQKRRSTITSSSPMWWAEKGMILNIGPENIKVRVTKLVDSTSVEVEPVRARWFSRSGAASSG